MLATIQEIGVIQSVIIAACIGFMLGMLVVIISESVSKARKYKEKAMLPRVQMMDNAGLHYHTSGYNRV